MLRALRIIRIRNVQTFSTKPAIKEEKYYENQLKEFEKISNITHKVREKKPQKPPFLKNLLLGQFDTDILTYPEITNEELSDLNTNLKQVQTVLDRQEIQETASISREFLSKLGQHHLLGLQTSQFIGGRNLNVTESCRFMEALSGLNLKNSLINNESLGVKILLEYGSDRLKKKYLERLVSGESLSAFCILQPSPSNIDTLKRTATLLPDTKTWHLNGEKKWVVNGSDADLLIVVANNSCTMKDEIIDKKFSAFVVERDFGGITSKKYNTVDPNVQVSDLLFENTPVPAENVIGGENMAEHIMKGIFSEHRLSIGPMCTSLMKNIINQLVQHCLKNPQESVPLHEMDAVLSKIGKIATSLYVTESMIYLTSGLLDTYENQDCELESTIVKIFSSEQALQSTISCFDLLGIEGNLEDHWCFKLHNEALCQISLNDGNDSLKTFIALLGIRHAGVNLHETIKKLRNPLFYASFILKRIWTNRKQAEDNPKLNLHLKHYLHPSCIIGSQKLEYCVLRLQYATEVFLARYGQELVNQHMDLRRFAECLMDIYGMTACLGRASRSYCIGLQNSDAELMMATAFCISAMERVRSKLLKIIEGPYQTNDNYYRTIAKRVFKSNEYFPMHPLTRNF